ncbi:Protein of unknown function [Roseomonas rosea]|jgi:Protein of unknown function (DUF3574)|uniref:DUF3574 domain-containing protein n=1 Tax=Muricoccus roseus TaxID=198092 RepID=A0A1M6IQX3_9PROT|nr:DUF3574 domain-containing protein [Roseomonas rosea]SHJ36823.1 Protein of unknown function [Roseomonas rosea]
MRAAAALLPLLLAACTAPPSCPAGTAPAVVAELAFGRNADGVLRVGEADWSAFLAEEATPRFPDGLSSLDAQGQWRAPDGRIAREPAKLLWLVLPGATLEEASRRTEPLAAAYKARFGQESVLRSLRSGCAGF